MLHFKRFLLFFTVVAVLTFVVYLYIGEPLIGIDDGNIFLTYAKHISEGDGFVFNSGSEKVEGFTSLLWVLICAAFFKISQHPEPLLIGFLLLLTSFTVSFVYEELKQTAEKVNKQWSDQYLLPFFLLFLVAVGPSYVTWSILSLMENGLWNFLFLCATVFVLRVVRTGKIRTWPLLAHSIIGGLLVLTRPEALLWSAILFTAIFVATWFHRLRWWPAFVFLGIQGLMTFILTQFRLYYFGYPLPNTYYAKVSHNRTYNLKEGFNYFLNFVTGHNAFVTILLLALLLMLLMYRRQAVAFLKRDPSSVHVSVLSLSFVAVFIFCGLAVPFFTGGDHFGSFRFYQGILLLLAWGIPAIMLLLLCSKKSSSRVSGAILFAGLTAVVIAGRTLLNLKKVAHNEMAFEFYLARDGREKAVMLNEFWPRQKPSVGMIAVGGFAYKYEGKTIDLMGLNNTMMGHSPGDRTGIKNHAAFNKTVFYQLEPELLLPQAVTSYQEACLLYLQMLTPQDFSNRAMKLIFLDATFREQYVPIVIQHGTTRVFAFSSKPFLSNLKNDSRLVVQPIKIMIASE